MSFRLIARTGHPDFLDLPWDEPLEEWDSPRFVEVARGLGRHVVRFVDYDGSLYALKELPPRLAQREYRLLRALTEVGLPAVEAVGVVSERGASEESVLITRYLEYSSGARSSPSPSLRAPGGGSRPQARDTRSPSACPSCDLLLPSSRSGDRSMRHVR